MTETTNIACLTCFFLVFMSLCITIVHLENQDRFVETAKIQKEIAQIETIRDVRIELIQYGHVNEIFVDDKTDVE